MLIDEVVKLLEKHASGKEVYLHNINKNIKDIEQLLREFRNEVVSELYAKLSNDTSNDTEEEEIVLFDDVRRLKTYIQEIAKIHISINEEADVAENVAPNCYSEKVIVRIVSDKFCPACGMAIESHKIYFRRNESGLEKDESAIWYRCPVCGKLYVLDVDLEEFDSKNTNLQFEDKFYHRLIIYDDVVVTLNINKCSANGHKLHDVSCKIPIVQPSGMITEVTKTVSYCETCKKYTMLKSVYDSLDGIPVCAISDETRKRVSGEEDAFIYNDKGGSKLYKYGYNVNCNDQLTEAQRRSILSIQLLTEKMTRNEIISTLDTLINNGIKRADSKRSWNGAVKKWKSDKDFVLNFNREKCLKTINVDRLILKFSV